MGASTFEMRVEAVSAAEAYKLACQQTKATDGDDVYGGNITSTDGFVLVRPSSGELLYACVERLLDMGARDKHEITKWGKVGCVDLCPGQAAGTRLFFFFGWGAT